METTLIQPVCAPWEVIQENRSSHSSIKKGISKAHRGNLYDIDCAYTMHELQLALVVLNLIVCSFHMSAAAVVMRPHSTSNVFKHVNTHKATGKEGIPGRVQNVQTSWQASSLTCSTSHCPSL